jgi:2-oxoglutarate ferredoxin oxidoreductase subunit gamma
MATEFPTEEYCGVEFTRLARHEAGHIMVANVIAVAFIAGLTDLFTKEDLTRVVLSRAPKGTEEKNHKAIEIGFREAGRFDKVKLNI